jgi:sortase A
MTAMPKQTGELRAGIAPALLLLRWARRLFLGAGVLLLAYSAFVVIDTRWFQERKNRLLEISLRNPPPAGDVPAAVMAGGLIGRIEIPRLGLSEIVVEGADARVLRRAAGHVPGTALPGQAGNTAITGHRDTFFRPLRKIRRDDLIRVTTLQGEFLYRVVSTGIVDPEDTGVLDADDGQVLTLITCYPFYFVGAAPQRFIVRAERVTDAT